MVIHIESNIDHMIGVVDRLIGLPDFKTTEALDAALDAGFAEVLLATHIDTASLVGSMKKESESGSHSWEGKISAGGSTPGPKNPVNYAIYEKARGGDHDFFEPLEHLDAAYKAAIKIGMLG